jgi:NAD+ synthase (glutamine-hydrolysing)
MQSFRVALAQVNPTVGDLKGNARLVGSYIRKAKKAKADLVAFPELVLTGYPPEDLLLKPSFTDANLKTLKQIIPETRGITAVIGFINKQDDIYNAAALIHDGKWLGTYHKHYLPNYGVFDEYRYFQKGDSILVFARAGLTIGLSICEDIWQPTGPLSLQTVHGDVDLAVSISASPFYRGRSKEREQMLSTRARDHTVAIAYVNIVGGQDELIFDGNSLVLDEKGNVLARGRGFCEDLVVADLNVRNVFRARLLDPRRRLEKRASSGEAVRIERIMLPSIPSEEGKGRPAGSPMPGEMTEIEEIFHALVLGIRDYFQKNGFQKALVGLSGGIDSSLTAALATQALGSRNVHGIFMPSPFSSEQSRNDAEALAKNLKLPFQVLPIDSIYDSYLKTLQSVFRNRRPDVTEENIQARIRGNLLMALSNKFGWLVLTTGNKSETSVGYSTLYGDTAGGLAVLKDVPKMTVYGLSRFVNQARGKEVIPRSVMEKAPSAELRPNQRDTDSLPPYEQLDPILHAYVEEDLSMEEIVHLGHPRKQVQEVLRMVDRNEYKRRQGPPGLKITPKAFGRDRRLPITNRHNS